jgi:uncharacterized protein
MDANAAAEKQPLTFFWLVFVLSLPVWLLGGHRLPLPVKLPVSAVISFVPLVAATVLSYRRLGIVGVKALLTRALDYQKVSNKWWWLPILFLLPCIYILSYAIIRAVELPLPPNPHLPWQMAPVFLLLFFPAALGEELGWMGYAIGPLQNRWGALTAGLMVGIVWALWHIIPDVQNQQPATWIVWHRLYSVALRILIVWVYNNTGKSVVAASLFHTMDNLSWSLFPNYGSHYNPFVTSLITWFTVAGIVFVWEPATLARYRYARSGR